MNNWSPITESLWASCYEVTQKRHKLTSIMHLMMCVIPSLHYVRQRNEEADEVWVLMKKTINVHVVLFANMWGQPLTRDQHIIQLHLLTVSYIIGKKIGCHFERLNCLPQIMPKQNALTGSRISSRYMVFTQIYANQISFRCSNSITYWLLDYTVWNSFFYHATVTRGRSLTSWEGRSTAKTPLY